MDRSQRTSEKISSIGQLFLELSSQEQNEVLSALFKLAKDNRKAEIEFHLDQAKAIRDSLIKLEGLLGVEDKKTSGDKDLVVDLDMVSAHIPDLDEKKQTRTAGAGSSRN